MVSTAKQVSQLLIDKQFELAIRLCNLASGDNLQQRTGECQNSAGYSPDQDPDKKLLTGCSHDPNIRQVRYSNGYQTVRLLHFWLRKQITVRI